MFKNAAHIVLFQDSTKKILLTQRHDNKLWVMPGGHLALGESFEQAVVREVREETGLKVKVVKLGLVLKIPNSKQEKRVYIGEVVGGDEQLSDEVTNIGWFDVDNLPLMTFYEKERIRTVFENGSREVTREFKVEPFREVLNLLWHPKLLFNAILVEFRNRKI